MSPEPDTWAALITRAPVRRATSRAERRALIAVQLDDASARVLARTHDLLERGVDEHAAQLDPAAQRRDDALRLGRASSGAGCPRRRPSRSPTRPARPPARRPARSVIPQIFTLAAARRWRVSGSPNGSGASRRRRTVRRHARNGSRDPRPRPREPSLRRVRVRHRVRPGAERDLDRLVFVAAVPVRAQQLDTDGVARLLGARSSLASSSELLTVLPSIDDDDVAADARPAPSSVLPVTVPPRMPAFSAAVPCLRRSGRARRS